MKTGEIAPKSTNCLIQNETLPCPISEQGVYVGAMEHCEVGSAVWRWWACATKYRPGKGLVSMWRERDLEKWEARIAALVFTRAR